MDQHGNLIDGEWVTGVSPIIDRSPSDLDDVVGEFAGADADQTTASIDAARRAFPEWSEATPQQRFDILDRAGTAILNARKELAELLAREEGKPLSEATGEVTKAGYVFKFFAGEAARVDGAKVPSLRPGVEVEVTREPLGVIGIITPWNFPIGIPAWKTAPALAYGNCVVFKPAELVPASGWMLARLLNEAGVPKGVFNLVMGKGRIVGETLLASPDVDAVTFTGSVSVGRRVLARAAETGKKVQLEMGGKNPLVVLDDADLDVAVKAAINGAYFATGQRCTASSRLIVTEAIHDRFVAAMKDRMNALKVDHALKPETDLGPVVSQDQLDQDLDYIEIGRKEGAVLEGGERLNRETEGYYLAPVLFTESTNQMRINREEIFGPVAAVIRVRDYEEALAVANDTEFGLSSGICTTSLKHASHFKRHSKSGMVMVNLPTGGSDYHVPFGGRKASSYGPREQGHYAQEFFTIVKTAYTAAG